ncbi:hypothetical protein TSUD_307040 [Trifolium subterraneum]|uniref:Uncharacterized protein n=1 Tax=Trifolium subterraneum TaxID=3900 RepID=A0A2Z6NBA6_TRISU|nr:hypothetical protein TSUD_307040 [Trifolium subterraneum]
MDMKMSKKKADDEIIPKKKKKRAEIDLESVDVKAQILRMKKHLVEQKGFPEDNIIVIIEDEKDIKPTGTNIREHLYKLVEWSHRGDILFIHLIAYGCSDGYILTPDKEHIDDSYFRALIVRAVRLGLNLTFVSDCLIQPKARCRCPRTRPPPPPVLTLEERLKFLTNPDILSGATYAIGYYRFIPFTNLSHVDILTLQGEGDKTKTITETTPTPLPSRVILFTPFPCDHNNPPWTIDNDSEVVFPPPTGYKHTSYGAFTNSILNVIEETPRGQVTNLELAQKAMIKLGGKTPPSLSCSHLIHARAPFLC